MSWKEYETVFKQEVESRAGRPYLELTWGEQETVAKRLLREKILSRPAQFIGSWAKSFLKYLFVPIELIARRVAYFSDWLPQYHKLVRPIPFALCLPLWVLAILPPWRNQKGAMFYYLVIMLILLYVLGVSSLISQGGERMRFPVLAFLLSLTAINAQAMVFWIARIGKGARKRVCETR